MPDKCKVGLTVYIQEPKKDKQGNIIDAIWVERVKGRSVPRNVSVKVAANAECLAHIRITVADQGVVTLHEGPPMPDETTCTKYQERVYYCTGFKAIDKNKEVVTFRVDADCKVCKQCEGTADDDGKVHFTL